MASRFQRDSRNALFSSYDAQPRSRPSPSPAPNRSGSRNSNHTPSASIGPYGAYPTSTPSSYDNFGSSDSSFRAYPGSGSADGGFRSATPNKKGQYSDAVIDELESQNDEHVSEMTKKVRMLKDITVQIGDEIRDSTAFAETMNNSFEATSKRLRGTMNRMLVMAQKTGVGWRVWLGFFLFIFLLFTYVWLF
ncbi:Hypothetical protein R9X50_00402600 [Acrodontium crateriforme]|uniref:t-SNARE coiled-coil homology domain-containing protein n=1 Tax=Acrodontium crateriforme TaxID=150365 RepID=A0AAQ3M5D3_9PEZI|nr:Hypothetical protein R9X50_00402600 [Acrodontium crateriforme]